MNVLFLLILLQGWYFAVGASAQNDGAERLRLVVMSYNIHHAEGADGQVDIERIARIIRSADPDLVALQEVDRFVERTDRADQAQQLADLTGMHMAFGFAMTYQGGDFGNVVLSKHPFDSLAVHPLPGEPGEDRVLMEAHLTLPAGARGERITFLATHLDTYAEPREASIPLILDVMPEEGDVLHILAGDLNDRPGSPALDALGRRFANPAPDTLFTYPAGAPDRQIDYVLFTPAPGWSAAGVRVIHAPVASDHAPVLTTLVRTPE